jgi:hypothetical protein
MVETRLIKLRLALLNSTHIVKTGKVKIMMLLKRKRRGFMMMEVLLAIIILTGAVLAVVHTIGYMLTMTVASRDRMDSFSTLERVGTAAIASRREEVDPGVDLISVPLIGGFSIDGTPITPFPFKMLIYREKARVKPNKILSSPTFVVFQK